MTRTEELIEKIADLRYRSDYCGKELKEFIELPPYLQGIYIKEVTSVLQICKNLGLEFVVKDAELPENPVYDIIPVDEVNEMGRARGRGYETAQIDMLNNHFNKTEAIEI